MKDQKRRKPRPAKPAGTEVGEAAPLVFISHSGEDTWVARQIAAGIERCGARTFLDVSCIQFADDPDQRIAEAVAEAAELVVLLTPWAIERPWVWVEISLAHYHRKPPCPMIVLLHGLSRSDFLAIEKVPAFLKQEDIIPLNRIDDYFADLARRTGAKRDA